MKVMTKRHVVFNGENLPFLKCCEFLSDSIGPTSTSVILLGIFPMSTTSQCVGGLLSNLHQFELHNRCVYATIHIESLLDTKKERYAYNSISCCDTV